MADDYLNASARLLREIFSRFSRSAAGISVKRRNERKILETAKTLSLAIDLGIRFQLDGSNVILLGDDYIVAKLIDSLRPHRNALKSLLRESLYGHEPSNAVATAAQFLRFGPRPYIRAQLPVSLIQEDRPS
jgi:hypothetical protein